MIGVFFYIVPKKQFPKSTDQITKSSVARRNFERKKKEEEAVDFIHLRRQERSKFHRNALQKSRHDNHDSIQREESCGQHILFSLGRP
jgi:hypothetical protein